jgi:hypothetical protein
MVLPKCGLLVLTRTTLGPSVKHLDHKANATFSVISFIIVIMLFIAYFKKSLLGHMVVNLSLQLTPT